MIAHRSLNALCRNFCERILLHLRMTELALLPQSITELNEKETKNRARLLIESRLRVTLLGQRCELRTKRAMHSR